MYMLICSQLFAMKCSTSNSWFPVIAIKTSQCDLESAQMLLMSSLLWIETTIYRSEYRFFFFFQTECWRLKMWIGSPVENTHFSRTGKLCCSHSIAKMLWMSCTSIIVLLPWETASPGFSCDVSFSLLSPVSQSQTNLSRRDWVMKYLNWSSSYLDKRNSSLFNSNC